MKNFLFNELNVSKEILRALEKMGFDESSPIQSLAIPPILEGKDVTAQAPTGTGKTCAFGIPIVEMVNPDTTNISVVILAPTRELVIQIAKEINLVSQFKEKIKILPIYGGQPIDRQILLLKRRPQIIVATPGRLMDHMRRRTIKLDNITTIILDEADEMLNMGFREDIDQILKSVPENRQTILFSATISKEIKEITLKYQKDAVFIKIAQKELTVPTVEQFYLEVKGKSKIDVLTNLIDMNSFKRCLVFCNTKKMVDDLVSDINARGYTAEALHGDMRQVSRDRVMNKYREGAVDILVATDVAARGIDVNDVEAVFNFDVPSDDEYYVHRIGRTGRAKKTGVSYTFVANRDKQKLRDIMKYTKSNIKLIPVPSPSDVEEIKINTLLKKITKIIEKEDLAKYKKQIEKIASTENSITPIDIAAALLSVNMNKSISSKIKSSLLQKQPDNQRKSVDRLSKIKGAKDNIAQRVSPRKKRAEVGMERMFINMGTLDKIRPRHIVEMINSNSSLNAKDIGVINVYDKYSFFEVPTGFSQDVLDNLNGINFKSRTVSVERANQ